MTVSRRTPGTIGIAALAGACLAVPATAAAPPMPVAPGALKAGATTKGGATRGAKVIHVTSLADAGPGSLRAAVDTPGPRVIVFDVGGRIRLASDLRIHGPFVTIAGQTAPSPGIALWGAALRVRTHDVVIQHIAVRAGPGPDAKTNDNRDAISIDGSPKGSPDQQSYQVRLENVSASWSVDEALSLWYATTRQVTIRHSIVSEALRNAGHPKGQHSMGLLVGTNVQTSEVVGNLLADNTFRNPVIAKGGQAFVANNYVVNPGNNAIHFYATGSQGATKATVVNNWIESGADTRKTLVAVGIPLDMSTGRSGDEIYTRGNDGVVGPQSKIVGQGAEAAQSPAAPIWSATWSLLPTRAVKADVLRYAGSRPGDRDAVDRRLIADIRAGRTRIVDRPPEAGSPDERPTRRVAEVPKDPFGPAPGGRGTRIEAWLCQQHLAVGGAPSAECPGGG